MKYFNEEKFFIIIIIIGIILFLVDQKCCFSILNEFSRLYPHFKKLELKVRKNCF
jgi:hypothetical protein